MKRAVIYARVSTRDQNPQMQLDDLRKYVEARGWALAGEFVDHGYSGSLAKRPALDQMMAEVRRRNADVVLCWRFDRMARSTRHLIEMLELFRSLNVDFYSHQESVDTSTPSGKVLFTVIGAFAEFERSIISERVRAGLTKAKALGVRLGRPRAQVDTERILETYAQTRSIRLTATTCGLSRALVHRTLRRLTEKPIPVAV
jgi:DNA invertase Pin-like site-specific DNA recombinase